MGVSEAAFAQAYDPLNETIRQQTAALGYDEVMVAARTTHDRMRGAVVAFDPAVVDRGGITSREAARLGDEVHENLTVHYDEHRAYIEQILGSS